MVSIDKIKIYYTKLGRSVLHHIDKLVIDDLQSFKDTEKYHSILAENEEGQGEMFSPLKKSIITKIQYLPFDEKADSLLHLHRI